MTMNKHEIVGMNKAKVLSVVNRKGVVFKVGQTAYFMTRKFKIKAFRTDTSMPNWLSTRFMAEPSFWIMAQGKTSWMNIDMMRKTKKS